MGNKGFSLIEVIVAMGIMGAFVLGFMRLSERMVESENKMMDFIEMTDFISRMRYVLNDTVACNKTFNANAMKNEDQVILPTKLKNIISRRGEVLAKINENIGSFITLEDLDIQVEEYAEELSEEEPYFVNLVFRVKGRSQKGYGKIFSMSIPVLLKKLSETDFQFISCDSLNSGVAQELTNQIMKKTCSSLGVEYDPQTGECIVDSKSMDMSKMLDPQMIKDIQKMFQK